MRITLHHGDCLVRMADLPEESVCSVVCDPPYNLSTSGSTNPGRRYWAYFGFSGREDEPVPKGKARRQRRTGKVPRGFMSMVWDGSDIAFSPDFWFEVYRVLVHGGVIKTFGGSRTFHRMTASLDYAGFEKIHIEAWTYGSGFPKSLNVSKALDKQAGFNQETQKDIQVYLKAMRENKGLTKSEVDRAVFGGTTRYSWVEGRGGSRANEVYLPTPEEWRSLKIVLGLDDRFDAYIEAAIPLREHRSRVDGGKALLIGTEDGDWGYQQNGDRWNGQRRITRARMPDAKAWEGWGTALKPSWEPVLVGHKPPSDKA